jgi:lipopolysaccharide/colanic/teichoic acid biosynthesis glycosyltransferase
VFEIALATIGLVATAPLLIVVAILIKFTSKGPILFRQQRVGLSGSRFTLLKLRTMTVASSGPLITSANDGRVTRLGRPLRRFKIDELPELWNVLRGDMSFVGPRPEVPEFVDLSDPMWKTILTHRPGITDPVTLRLRNEEQLLARVVDKERYYREVVQPLKLRGYYKFVESKSWKTDIRLIFRTLKAVAFPSSVKSPTTDDMRSVHGFATWFENES